MATFLVYHLTILTLTSVGVGAFFQAGGNGGGATGRGPGATPSGAQVWPNGTWGLFKANSGCPEGGVPWLEGARTFDTEDSDSHNYFSDNVWNVLAGTFDANDITTEFCMKNSTLGDDMTSPEWPMGNYCLLRLGDCPRGFKNGTIRWDGDDWNNHNSVSGTLPTGHYDSNTEIEFCCRSDGYPENPISLPTSRPFVLLRYGYLCQKVQGMKQTDAFVRWDDEDTLNTDMSGGATPFDDGGVKDHKLHVCYYASPSSLVG